MEVRRSGYNFRHVLILGYNEQAIQMARRIDANQVLGYKIVGFIAEQTEPASRPPLPTSHPVVGSLLDLQAILEKGPVDEIILCLPFMTYVAAIADAVRLAVTITLPRGQSCRDFRSSSRLWVPLSMVSGIVETISAASPFPRVGRTTDGTARFR